MYEILPMTMSDLEEVAELEARCFPDPWPLELFVREVEDREENFSRVVRDGAGRLAAYTVAWIIADEAHLGNVAVAPEHRGAGLAGELVEELLGEARDRGAAHVLLEVRRSNEGAIRLYEKHGFEELTVRKGYYQDDGEDALVMICRLARTGEAGRVV